MFYHLIVRDIAEILFYSSCIFIVCQWLKTDKTKNILIYFFGYCTLTLSAWVLELPTLAPFLLTYAPVALVLFIILHEKTLQRNLVTLCAITPARSEHEDWLDTLLSSSLATINSNKAITVIIEHKDAVDHFIQAPFSINADMVKNVLDIFVTSSLYDEHKMIWVHTSGKIKGINIDWIHQQEIKTDAFLCTTHSDAIVFSAHPINRAFSLIINGKEIKNISAHQLHTMIKKQLSSITSSHHKGAYREHNKAEKTISH